MIRIIPFVFFNSFRSENIDNGVLTQDNVLKGDLVEIVQHSNLIVPLNNQTYALVFFLKNFVNIFAD